MSCPNYDASSGAMSVAKMMEAAEAGEFMGLDSMRDRKKRKRQKGIEQKSEVETEEKDGTRNDSSDSTDGTSLTNRDNAEEAHSQPTGNYEGTETPATRGASRPGTKTTRGPRSMPKPDLPEPNKAMSAAMSKFRTRYKDLQNAPPLRRIERLLHMDKPIQAAQMFLETHPPSLPGISAERRDLAVKIFYANIKADNVFLARNIFNRIDAVDKVTHALWELLLLALGKRGNIDSVATIYMAHANKFTLSWTLLDMVLRALIDSYNLKGAKTLIYNNLHEDRQCGLCGVYLSGLWKKTRDISLVVSQFERLLSIVKETGTEISEKLFNPVLRAYIDVGKDEDARILAEDMCAEYDIELSARTRGLFVFAKALKCDWDGVESGLQELDDLGLTVAEPRDFSKIFDRIFLEYWLANSGPAIRDFVFRAIEKYKLLPDQVLFDHITEAFVEKGDADMIAEFLKAKEEGRWKKIKFDQRKFMEMVRRRRLASEMSPVGLWHMFRVTQQKFGMASTSQRILGYERNSFPDEEAYKLPGHNEPSTWLRKAMKMTEPAKGINMFAPLHKQMIHYMQTGKWSEALRVYTTAKHAGKVMKHLHVELAVTASILHKGLTDEARFIVEDNMDHIRNFGQSIMPIFFQRVLQADRVDEAAAMKMAVLNFYDVLESRMYTLKHHATVAASTQLIARGKHQAAADLMADIYKSRYGLALKFDGVAMKQLVRAFGGVGNLEGIRWGILSGLKRPSALNRDFVVEVHRVIAALTSQPIIKPNQTEESYNFELDQLRGSAALLGKKLAEESAPSDTSENQEMDGKQDEIPTEQVAKSISEVLVNWDEELELEKVLRRTEQLPPGVDEDWSEDSVWREHVKKR